MQYKKSSMLCILALAMQQLCILAVPKGYGKTHFIIGAPPRASYAELPTAPLDDVCSVYFSPDDNLQIVLCDYIANEQAAIDIAIFSFTDKKIANELLRAHKRGVRIRVTTDPSAFYSRFSKMVELHERGIPVYIYNMRYEKQKGGTLNNIMHNKFVIFSKNKNDCAYVWTGSFNFTRSAALSNQENALLIGKRDIVNQYKTQFERLITRSNRLKE